MSALDRKLMRDLGRLWAQALAIALVLACGVATLILAVGAYRSLDETRTTYYQRYRFADIFASVTRAPKELARTLAEIPGVSAVETRIQRQAVLDIDGFDMPASGVIVSLPDNAELVLNRLYMRSGRLPEAGHVGEVVVNEAFALANRFDLGSRFGAILNGKKRPLTIVGIALSPEYIYAIGPGDLVPNNRRFAVMWMSERALAAAYDMDGAFDSVLLSLRRDASEVQVIERVDDALERFGGRGAYGRPDQLSHAFIESELDQLQGMARILPPIFMLVAAFLMNMAISRLIALEREQIGLLKAIGYGRLAIAGHYLKFVVAIALVGDVIGVGAGMVLGRLLTSLYASMYQFPFLVFIESPDLYVIACGISIGSAVVGALGSVTAAARLPPAVAMLPPAPPRYRRLFGGRLALGFNRLFSQSETMMLRHIVRWPVRAGLTMLGMAMAVAVLVGSLFGVDATNAMVDISFFDMHRQFATIGFASEKPDSILAEIRRLPAVLSVEPYRSIRVRLVNGARAKRVGIIGMPADGDLSRVIGPDLQPVRMPETGIVLTTRMAQVLDARVGDLITVEMLEGRRLTAETPVTAVVESFFGLETYMNIGALNRLAREGPMVSYVELGIDPTGVEALYERLKSIPAAAALALQRVSLQQFRETLSQNMLVMIWIYAALGSIIAFGVVYNAARIQLSERARELASLRVLGFTRAEVSWILLAELGLLLIVAQPVGWLIGYSIAALVSAGMATDLYRVPLVIERSTYGFASLIVMSAAAVSALVVRRRIDRLDLVAVLKTRD